ncbi:unnamed protein product [Brassica oleracea var. botrytis]
MMMIVMRKDSLSSLKPSLNMDAKSRYRSEFRDCGGAENQSVQELESYAVYKCQETTKTVQGHKINPNKVLWDDSDCMFRVWFQGEKLLGSLGGIFSRTWKPKKSRSITGPVEKAKQDDGLADLSDLLSELKNMAVDMGTEIERQNNGLDHLQDDVDELNFRVKQSNQRALRLLGK